MNYPAAGFPNETKKACRILCPLCGRIHTHGYGEGQRAPHCDKMFIRADDTYSIIPVEEPFPEEVAKEIDQEVYKYQKLLRDRGIIYANTKGVLPPMKPDAYYLDMIKFHVMQSIELNRGYVDREKIRRSFNELRGRSNDENYKLF